MLETKSDKLSELHNSEGKKHFAKKLYYDALIAWNKVEIWHFKICNFYKL